MKITKLHLTQQELTLLILISMVNMLKVESLKMEMDLMLRSMESRNQFTRSNMKTSFTYSGKKDMFVLSFWSFLFRVFQPTRDVKIWTWNLLNYRSNSDSPRSVPNTRLIKIQQSHWVFGLDLQKNLFFEIYQFLWRTFI